MSARQFLVLDAMRNAGAPMTVREIKEAIDQTPMQHHPNDAGIYKIIDRLEQNGVVRQVSGAGKPNDPRRYALNPDHKETNP